VIVVYRSDGTPQPDSSVGGEKLPLTEGTALVGQDEAEEAVDVLRRRVAAAMIESTSDTLPARNGSDRATHETFT
jgi:hypothetical protein